MTGPTLQQQNDNQFDQQQQQQRHIGQFQKGFRMNEFLDINTAPGRAENIYPKSMLCPLSLRSEKFASNIAQR
jgi:hypothetical protein